MLVVSYNIFIGFEFYRDACILSYPIALYKSPNKPSQPSSAVATDEKERPS
jgi:hypothetical protein